MFPLDPEGRQKGVDSPRRFIDEIPGTMARSPAAAAMATSVEGISCTTLFFRCMTCCNCLLVMALTGLVLYQMNQMENLKSAVQKDLATISELQNEVREKQEGKIEELHQEVQKEHNLTFLTLAGIFTLLTCLISMFHMSSHLQRMNQPIIQRKIVAIIWMSPIYSITSFMTLLYPPMEGYMAIIKDFYESYCIYTFLSFLIVVLGRGSRENAVEVLAMRAHHLEQPTRLLSRWYEPPPETSDVAKANAVITECQIFAMQFVFIRPLTTVMYVIYLSVTDPNNDSYTEPYNSTGNRVLQWIQEEAARSLNETDLSTMETLDPNTWTSIPTMSPVEDFAQPVATWAPTPTAVPASDHVFSEATKEYFKSFSFVLTMIVNVSVFFAFTGLLKFYHAVHNDLAWCRPWPKFLTIKGVVFLTFWQGLAILILVNLNGDDAGGSEKQVEEDPESRARKYQNILICCEMLFFSLTHWCVFPAEEWQKGYEPPIEAHQPGIGIQDFVSDVGQIYRRRRRRRQPRVSSGGKRVSPRRDDHNGLYHRPSTASQMSTTAPMEDDEDDESFQSQKVASNEVGPTARVASSNRGWQTRIASPIVPRGSTLDEDSSESLHYGDDDLVLEENMKSPVGVAARPRFLSDESSAKADDADYDMQLI